MQALVVAALVGSAAGFPGVPAPAASAGAVSARILDKDGEPVEDAVVLAFPEAGGAGPKKPDVVDVDQVDKEFVPHVSAVAVGTAIRFPNYDQIRHHVYSFSPAKSFEIPLYKGVPADPIVFDEPGVVTLGCNIHDWMQGFVLVTEAPFFAVSDGQGTARLEGLPEGPARLEVWHPELKGKPEATAQSVLVDGSGSQSLLFEIDRKRTWKVRRGGGRGGDRYR